MANHLPAELTAPPAAAVPALPTGTAAAHEGAGEESGAVEVAVGEVVPFGMFDPFADDPFADDSGIRR
ncbi:hypothetical protein [Rhodococcus sp. WAY2]|uniref:hypothetical protein n=1 Tax=Rhodococcus sp. WAY2 TaxID=2663121 RepID=UPI00131F74DF|nr:hypothetical protein [Rhodococcus sp. WAY2]QHE72784.1 hypothetical protein GFS60_06432 [Rhodococcus sp. WAY2]